MAQIVLKGSSVADFSISGSIVTVAGHQVNCSDRQRDDEVIVEVRQGKSGVVEAGNGPYLAVIRIPARRYNDETGPEDEEGNPTLIRVADPLDPNSVEVTLWPTAAA